MKENVQLHDKVFEPYLSAKTIEASIHTLAKRLNENYADKNPMFIGVLNGAFMFVSDLMKAITIPCEVNFVKLASYEGTNSSGKVSELIGLPKNMVGRDIVILEDIVDTGQTVEKLYSMFEEESIGSLEIVTLLFKPDVYQKKYPINYYGIEIPNTFVVGFGLDYDGHGRNLKEIYKLTEK